jgi:hypothetical protein
MVKLKSDNEEEEGERRSVISDSFSIVNSPKAISKKFDLKFETPSPYQSLKYNAVPLSRKFNFKKPLP